jgi:hypothetical protein
LMITMAPPWWTPKRRTSNIERPTSNFEWKRWKNKLIICKKNYSNIKTAERNANSFWIFPIEDLFFIGRWMFDVRRSSLKLFVVLKPSFKTTLMRCS